MLTLLLSAAFAAPDWSEIASETAEKPPDDDLVFDLMDLEGEHGEDGDQRVDDATKLTTLIRKADPPLLPEERQKLYALVMAGDEEARADARAALEQGDVPMGPLLEGLPTRLALMGPEDRADTLERLSSLPQSVGDNLSFVQAEAVVEQADAESWTGEELSVQLEYAFGLKERPPIDWDGLVDGLASGATDCEALNGWMRAAAADDLERLEAAARMCAALEGTDAAEAKRRFLFEGATAEDDATRAAALETAGAPADVPMIGPKTASSDGAAGADPAVQAAQQRYLDHRLSIIQTKTNMSTFFMVAGLKDRELDAYNRRTWGVAEGDRELTTRSYAALTGQSFEYQRTQKKRKKKAILGFVVGGATAYAGLVGMLSSPYLIVYHENIGSSTPTPGYVVGGISTALFATGLSLGGMGIVQVRAKKYEARYPSLLLDREDVEREIERYNAKLREEIEEREGVTLSDSTPAASTSSSDAASTASEPAVAAPSTPRPTGRIDELVVRDDDRVIEPPEGHAAVVFVRPSPLAIAFKIALLGEDGRTLCQVSAKSKCIAYVPAGENRFTSWADMSPRTVADLEAGKTYYVKVSQEMGGAFTGMWVMEGLSPDHPEWKRLPKWLDKTKTFWPNPVGIDHQMERRGDTARERMAGGDAAWDRYDSERKARFTLSPEDGVTEPL